MLLKRTFASFEKIVYISYFSTTMINTRPKVIWGGKDLFYLTVYSSSSREVGAGTENSRNLKAGATARTKGKCCLLARSPWLTQPTFLYTRESLASWVVLLTSVLGPFHMNHQPRK